MGEVYIAGAAMTRVGRREESLPDLMAEAGRGALAAAGLERPDALVVSAMNPEEFVGEGNFASYVGTYLGLARVPSLRAETATSSGAAALFAAYAAVAAGLHRTRPRRRRREDDPPPDAPGLGADRPLDRLRTSAPTALRCPPWRGSSRGRG